MEIYNMDRVANYPTSHSEALNKIEDLETKLREATTKLSDVTIVVQRASKMVQLLDSCNPLANLFQDLLHIVKFDMNRSEFHSELLSSQEDPISHQSMDVGSVEMDIIQPLSLPDDHSQHADPTCMEHKVEVLENKGEKLSPQAIVGCQCGVEGCKRKVLFSRHKTPNQAITRLRRHFVIGHKWLKVEKFTYIELTKESGSVTSFNPSTNSSSSEISTDIELAKEKESISSSNPSSSSSSSETSTVMKRKSKKKSRVCYKCDKYIRSIGHETIPHLFNCYSWNCDLDFITAAELAKHRGEVHSKSKSKVTTPLTETDETPQQQTSLDMDIILVLTDIPEEVDNIEDDCHFSEAICGGDTTKDEINQEQENGDEEEKDYTKIAVLEEQENGDKDDINLAQVIVLNDLSLPEDNILVLADIQEERDTTEKVCHFSEAVDGPVDTTKDQINQGKENGEEEENDYTPVVVLDDLAIAEDKHISCREGVKPQHFVLNSIEGQEENMIEDDYDQHLNNFECVKLSDKKIILNIVNQVQNEHTVNKSICVQNCYVENKLKTEDESSPTIDREGDLHDILEGKEGNLEELVENENNMLKESLEKMKKDDESADENLVVQHVDDQEYNEVIGRKKSGEKRRVLDIWLLSRSRLKRCSACEGCKVTNCGSCFSCRDMIQFGGSGSHRQACQKRVCSKFEEARAERRRLKVGVSGMSEARKQRVCSRLMEVRTEKKQSKVRVAGRREACQQIACSKIKKARAESRRLKVGEEGRNGNDNCAGHNRRDSQGKLLSKVRVRHSSRNVNNNCAGHNRGDNQGKFLSKVRARRSSRLCNTDVMFRIGKEVLGSGYRVKPRLEANPSLINVNMSSGRKSLNDKRCVTVELSTDCQVLMVKDIFNK